MHRLSFIFLLILSTGSLICKAEEIDACEFDQYVLGMFNEIAVSDNSSRHLELLDFIAEHGHKTNAEICADKRQREKLIRIAYTLYDEKKGDNEFKNVYPKYAFFAGQEEEGRIATNEDNAMYNLLLDYMIAKYDNQYEETRRLIASATANRLIVPGMSLRGTLYAKHFGDHYWLIRGINGSELVDLTLKYYDQLGEKYRKMIPLKLVYIPVAKEMAD